MRCIKCGYDLRGLAVPTCPECGRVFDPADDLSFLSTPVSGRRYLVWNVLAFGLLIVPFFVSPIGSALYFYLPMIAASLVLASLWRTRRGVTAKHAWIEHPAALWIGFGIGIVTLLLAAGMVLFAWQMNRVT